MASLIRHKYVDSLSTRERKCSVFEFFYPDTRFQKSAFTQSMWKIGQNVAKHVHLHTKAFPCGWLLRLDLFSSMSTLLDYRIRFAYECRICMQGTRLWTLAIMLFIQFFI